MTDLAHTSLCRVIDGEDRPVVGRGGRPAMCEVLPGERVRIDLKGSRLLVIECDHLGRPQLTAQRAGLDVLYRYGVGPVPTALFIYGPAVMYGLVAECRMIDDRRLFVLVYPEPQRPL